MGVRKKQACPAPKINTDSALTGSFAVARRGREAGRMFIIVGCADASDRVFIADGRKRRLARPKLKGVRHIDIVGMCEQARELLPVGGFTDGDIRRAVRGAELTKTPKGEPNAEG